MEKYECRTIAEHMKVILDLQMEYGLPFDIGIVSVRDSKLFVVTIFYEEEDEKLIQWVLEKAGIEDPE